MNGDTTTTIEKLQAPWGKEIEVQDLVYEGGALKALRLRIREGRRFTILDLDAPTARRLADLLEGWVKEQP